MQLSNSQQVFFAIVRAGLWEKEVRLSSSNIIDLKEVFRIAEEQSVVGILAAGIEYVKDYRMPQEDVLTIAGRALQLEQYNIAMNSFIESLVEKLNRNGIKFLLVKGQGVAQCYERPLWRVCGDVDFLFSADDYAKARKKMIPMATKVDTERGKHQGMTIGSWTVELHGHMYSGLSRKIDNAINEVQNEVCEHGKIRIWHNGNVPVNIPAANEDIMLVFTHFIKHFYKGGLGLRQICDWCRLLWTYRSELDLRILEQRIKRMGLMSEWKAFGAFAVNYLGMPIEAMPFLNMDECTNLKKKADRICSFIMEVGNFGHNRDTSYYGKYPFVVRKAVSAWRRTKDIFHHTMIFPLDSLHFFFNILWNGLRSAVRSE